MHNGHAGEAETSKELNALANVTQTRWNDPVTRPDMATWTDLLNDDSMALEAEAFALRRQSARKRLIDAAQVYVIRLGQAAANAGVTLPESSMLTGDTESQRIVMTGHQPVPFHGGLTFKYECTEETAIRTKSIGVAVIIDTDKGDPTAFQYPALVPNEDKQQCQIADATFCDAPNLYLFSQFLPVVRLTSVASNLESQLRHATTDANSKRFRQTADDFLKLAAADVTPAESSVITRWTNGIGNRLLELPLSAICAFPEVLEMTAELLNDADSFAATYNRELEQFRSDHDIRNMANPFPDLASTDEGQELPFWVLNAVGQTRHRLIVRTGTEHVSLIADGDELVESAPDGLRSALDKLALQGMQLVPRGAMVSAFLRLLFADLFVHGLGGEHYDPFTDRLVQSWWNVAAPPFTVASASEYLFEEQRDELHRLTKLDSQLRDLRYNPQRHFDRGVFNDDIQSRLRDLVQKKDSAIASMKTAHADGKSAKDIGRQIQQITDQIRATVDDAFHEDLTTFAGLSDSTQQAFECRTYPWFLFP